MSGSESSSPAAVTGLPVQPAEPQARPEPLSFSVHSLPEPALEQRRRTARGRLQMLMVMAVCAAPVLTSYFMYYVARPSARTAQGELIEPPRELPPAAALALRDPSGAAIDPQSLRGQWLLVVAAEGSCDPACERRLYLQRQLREMLGREKDRLDRVWLLTGGSAMRAALAPAMQQATVLSAERSQAAAWLEGPGDTAAGSPGTAPGTTPGTPPGTPPTGIDHWLYLVDPMGRLMMRFPADGNPSGIKRDLERVLRASASWDRAGREAP